MIEYRCPDFVGPCCPCSLLLCRVFRSLVTDEPYHSPCRSCRWYKGCSTCIRLRSGPCRNLVHFYGLDTPRN